MLEAVFLTQSSTDEVSEQIMQQHLENKQFHSVVQFRDKGVKFRAWFSEQCLAAKCHLLHTGTEQNMTSTATEKATKKAPELFALEMSLLDT